MLLEDPKNPHNPNARVNPQRRQINLLPQEQVKYMQKMRKKYKIAQHTGFVASQLSGRYLSPTISNRIANKFINADLERYERKRQMMNPDMYEDAASIAKEGLLKRGNRWVTTHGNRLKNWSLENPIQATVGGIAVSGLVQGVTGGIGSYIHHRAQMKTNPLYAQQTLQAKRELDAEQRQMQRAPARPQGQVPGLQQGPVLPSQAQVSRQKPQENTPPDEARPNNQKSPDKHQPQNAYVAVMRGMDMNNVNSAGKAMDPKQFKLSTTTKTNTRKESYGPVDAVMETVDRIEEIDLAGAVDKGVKAVKNFAPEAKKAFGTLKKEVKDTWHRAKPHLANAWKDAKTTWKRRSMAGEVGKKFRQNKQKSAWGNVKKAYSAARGKPVENIFAIADNIYEVAPLAAIGARLAASGIGRLAAKAASSGAGKFATRVVKKHGMDMAKSAAKDAAFSYAGTKIKRAVIGDSIEAIANNIHEGFMGTMWRGAMGKSGSFARKKALATMGRTAAVGLAGGVGTSVGTRLGNIGARRQRTEGFMYETIGAGALSNYELNPYKSMKDVNQYQRNQWISSVTSRVKRGPRHFNSPRKRASDDPVGLRSESIFETSIANDLGQIGSKIETGVKGAAKGALKGAAKGVGHWAKWAAHGNTGKKLAYTAAGLYAAKKAKDIITRNPKYLRKKAQKQRDAYNETARKMGYAQDRAEFRERRKQHYLGRD